jgi:hypothetical protein
MTWPNRHAIVVNGGGSGSGIANSMTWSPVPAWTGAAPVPRGRTLHEGTGSQRYSGSVSPSNRGLSWLVQWWSIWSISSSFQGVIRRVSDR